MLVFRGRPPFWVAVVWSLAGFLILATSLRQWKEARAFEREKRAAQAVVTGKSIEPAKEGANPRTRYRIEYRFRAEVGGDVVRQAEVAVEEWERLSEGDALTVYYRPGALDAPRLAGEPGGAGGALGGVILGAVFAAMGVAGAVWTSRRGAGVSLERTASLDEAAASIYRWLRGVGRVLLRLAAILGFVIGAGVVAELVPGVKPMHAYIEQRRSEFLTLAGAATAAGFVLFMGSILALFVGSHRTSASESFTVPELFRAWDSGALWRDPMWRRRACTIAGALLMSAGLWALMFVLGPEWLKVLLLCVFFFVAYKMIGMVRRERRVAS